ncbi:MAG: hypothetical protein ABIZ34_09285 [Candidatus Limnocylindrales bacterium]
MTKRTRGPAPRPTHRRPGTRPATSRPAQARQPAAITREIELETNDLVTVAEATEVPTAGTGLPTAARASAHLRARAKPGSLLAARAATEYVYVAQDLRRIAVVAGLLFGALIVLWIVLVLMEVSALY